MANPAPDRNRARELVRITESVAIPTGRRTAATAGRTRGRRPGDAATTDTVEMTGTSTLVVREGAAEDKARLRRGERVGEGTGADHDHERPRGYARHTVTHADRVEPGVMRLRVVSAAVAGATLVVVGEGRLDVQSLQGKAPIGVARLAARHGVPTVAVAGQVTVPATALRSSGIRAAYSLVDLAGDVATAIAAAPELLGRAGALIARTLPTASPPGEGD